MATVILCGGGPTNSTRMGSVSNKCFLEIGGRPLLSYSLEVVRAHPAISRILLCLSSTDHALFREQIGAADVELFPAAETRMQSIQGVLESAGFDPDELILIHDGARPFLSEALLTRLIDAVDMVGCDGAVLAVPPKDSILRVSGANIVGTLDRSQLCAVQSPAAGRYTTLMRARGKAINEGYLDRPGYEDSAVMQAAGMVVRLVPSSYENIKVTTPEDLLVAESLVTTRASYVPV